MSATWHCSSFLAPLWFCQSATVRSLDLTNNSIGEAGLLALARALASNETLVRLLLWGNRFTPPAADALGKILSTSRALTGRHSFGQGRLAHHDVCLRTARVGCAQTPTLSSTRPVQKQALRPKRVWPTAIERSSSSSLFPSRLLPTGRVTLLSPPSRACPAEEPLPSPGSPLPVDESLNASGARNVDQNYVKLFQSTRNRPHAHKRKI